MFSGVRRLRIGQAVALSEDEWRTFTYWAPRYQPPLQIDRDEAAGLVRHAVRHAVRERLAPADQTGILLSGGFDSGTLSGVAAPMVRERGGVLRAYSSVFPGEPYDESPSVRTLVGELGLASTQLRIHPQGSLDPSGALPAAMGHAPTRARLDHRPAADPTRGRRRGDRDPRRSGRRRRSSPIRAS